MDSSASNLNRRRLLAAAAASLLAGCAGPAGLRMSPRDSGNVDVAGGRLYYETAGQGDPVLLLHAFTLDTRMWQAQFDALSERYRVIAYDARGFGRSTLPRVGEPYSHVDDLVRLLDALDIRQPHLVGASMGGRFALDFALAHPDRYRSIALIDPVVSGWAWSQDLLNSYAPVIEASQRKDIAAAKAAWLAHPLFASARGNEAVYELLRRMVSDYSGWHFVNQDPERRMSPPASQRLAKIRGPILGMVGEYDLPDFQQIVQRLEREAKAQRIVVAGSGHLSPMEAAAGVNERLLEFFGRQT